MSTVLLALLESIYKRPDMVVFNQSTQEAEASRSL